MKLFGNRKSYDVVTRLTSKTRRRGLAERDCQYLNNRFCEIPIVEFPVCTFSASLTVTWSMRCTLGHTPGQPPSPASDVLACNFRNARLSFIKSLPVFHFLLATHLWLLPVESNFLMWEKQTARRAPIDLHASKCHWLSSVRSNWNWWVCLFFLLSLF